MSKNNVDDGSSKGWMWMSGLRSLFLIFTLRALMLEAEETGSSGRAGVLMKVLEDGFGGVGGFLGSSATLGLTDNSLGPVILEDLEIFLCSSLSVCQVLRIVWHGCKKIKEHTDRLIRWRL